MNSLERPDDFEQRRSHLKSMSDEALHAYFWELVDRIVAPLIEEARTHTSPSIERSVLLRMGFSSIESRQLVDQVHKHGLLGHGAGHLVLQLAMSKGMTIRDAGKALLQGGYWQELISMISGDIQVEP
jgi:D-ornithine 4,5-aminomutase subunit alpha